jgi:hypothetical protein
VPTFLIFPTISSFFPPKFFGCFFLSFNSPHVCNFLLITSFLPNLYSLSSCLSKMSLLYFSSFYSNYFPIFFTMHFSSRTHSRMRGKTKAS